MLHSHTLLQAIAAYVDTQYRHLVVERPQSHQQAAMGECAARSRDRRIEADTQFPALFHDLPGSQHVAKPAERHMRRCRVDDIGSPAFGRERRCAKFHRRIRGRLVFARGEPVQRGPQHAGQQDVARCSLELTFAVYPVLELDVDLYLKPARGRCRDP